MEDKLVVGSGLTPDWLKKRSNILRAIEEQLILGLQEPGRGLSLQQLQTIVEHQNPFADKKRACSFPLWKTIRLGTYKHADMLRDDLLRAGNIIGMEASEFLQTIPMGSWLKDIHLVRLPLDEFSLKRGINYNNLCKEAGQFGLALCPPEVGPQLRLEYNDQPMGERLVIATETLPLYFKVHDTLPTYIPGVLSVEHDARGKQLDAFAGFPNDLWNGDYQFVFAHP